MSPEFTSRAIKPGQAPSSIDKLADSVRPAGGAIDHSGATRESGTLTIVFADIENSAARSTELGEAKWAQILSEHTELVGKHVKANRGRIVKNHNDGFMMTYQSARQAIVASIGIQQDLDQHPDVKVRIGMHVGEGLMDRQGEIFGHYVTKAARVATLAKGGEILVTDLVKRIAASRGDLAFGEPVEATLEGLEDQATVFELLWRDSVK